MNDAEKAYYAQIEREADVEAIERVVAVLRRGGHSALAARVEVRAMEIVDAETETR